MAATQAIVDGLVKAVQDEDVLFVLYYLQQLPPGRVDDQGAPRKWLRFRGWLS